MLPPFCSICGQAIEEGPGESGLLEFALSPEEAAANKRFEEPGFTGHPEGLYWLCEKHYAALKPYQHLSWDEARQKLRA